MLTFQMTFREYVDARVKKGEKKGQVMLALAEASGITVQTLRQYYRGLTVGRTDNAKKIMSATNGKCTLEDLTGC